MKKQYIVIFDEGKDDAFTYRRYAEGNDVLEAVEFFKSLDLSAYKNIRILEVHLINKKDFELTTDVFSDPKLANEAFQREDIEISRVAKTVYEYDEE